MYRLPISLSNSTLLARRSSSFLAAPAPHFLDHSRTRPLPHPTPPPAVRQCCPRRPFRSASAPAPDGGRGRGNRRRRDEDGGGIGGIGRRSSARYDDDDNPLRTGYRDEATRIPHRLRGAARGRGAPPRFDVGGSGAAAAPRYDDDDDEPFERRGGRVEGPSRGFDDDAPTTSGPRRRQTADFERRQRSERTSPTIHKGPLNSITVAKDKGAAKYCYGCGATIVSKREQQADQTVGGEGGGGRSSRESSFQSVSMGLKSSAGGYWNQKKKELEISKIKNWGYCARCRALQNDNKRDRSPGDSQLEALSPSHEMEKVFREQVGIVREREDAVVVLCVDAVNPQGSIIKRLRNYVGGNPVLLAITRCDLLPEYVAQNWTPERRGRIERHFARLARDLHPAGVYLCSVDDDEDRDGHGLVFDGARDLAIDLLRRLDGRDPYVVGAANIGKSTLTDRIIDDVIAEHAAPSMERMRERRARRTKFMSKKELEKERKKRRYRTPSGDEMNHSRYAAVQESRVTKSSLPGTTLQNVRVPCFPDHQQALWDTPGLLLDPSLSHYPIRDFRRIKARKPARIKPQWHHDVGRKSFAFLVSESSSSSEDDEYDKHGIEKQENGGGKRQLPLLRIEIRLKKKRGMRDPDPVHLVWNSTLNDILTTNIVSIDESHLAERSRMEQVEAAKREQVVWAEQQGLSFTDVGQEDASEGNDREEATEGEEHPEPIERTMEDRATLKEQRRRRHEEWKRAKIAEMGERKWKLLQKERKHRNDRIKFQGTKLELVKEDEVLSGTAREVNIEHFGSLGFVSPSADALVRVFAPNSGIRPICHPPMVVPPQWDDYVRDDCLGDDDVEHEQMAAMKKWEKEMEGELEWSGMEMEGGNDDDWGLSYRRDDHGSRGRDGRRGPKDDRRTHRERYNLRRDNKQREWAEFSGEKIGWKFHEKPYYVKGIFVDGWQEIRKGEKDSGK